MRTAFHLARLGATVIMACKSEAKGAAAKLDIINELKQKHDMNNASLEVRSTTFIIVQLPIRIDSMNHVCYVSIRVSYTISYQLQSFCCKCCVYGCFCTAVQYEQHRTLSSLLIDGYSALT
jgi:hypothetical protein